MVKTNLQTVVAALVLVGLGLVPWISGLFDQSYYVTFFSRVLILAIAAVGLNLILGYGGLISMGHALYVGVGVYSVGILSTGYGMGSGWVHVGAALLVTAAMAIPIGLVCLRTSGMAFIMITLAFGQMAFYIAVTLRKYGGDDGMAIPARSNFSGISLADDRALYFAIYLVLLVVLYGMRRLVRSPFGLAIQGVRLNERRMSALGYPTLRYKMVTYLISAQICSLAGVLLANLVLYMSPSYVQWQMSGELLMMIVLGGMGAVIGPLYGALALLVLEETLISVALPLPWGLGEVIAKHPMIVVGMFVVLMAIGLKNGIHGFLVRNPRVQPVKPE